MISYLISSIHVNPTGFTMKYKPGSVQGTTLCRICRYYSILGRGLTVLIMPHLYDVRRGASRPTAMLCLILTCHRATSTLIIEPSLVQIDNLFVRHIGYLCVNEKEMSHIRNAPSRGLGCRALEKFSFVKPLACLGSSLRPSTRSGM